MKFIKSYLYLFLLVLAVPTAAFSAPQLALEVSPDPVRTGEPVKVGLTVTNSGSSVMSNVELRLIYPEHLYGLSTNFITTGGASNSVTCLGDHVGTSCVPGEVVVWSLGTIPPGGGVFVDMHPDVQNVADGTSIQFEAEVWVDGVQTLQRSRTVPVQAVPQFELSVDELMDPVSTAGDMVYTFTYSNIATTTSNTQLSFSLPGKTSFVSATDGGIYSSGTVTWDLQSLQGGSGGERRVRLAVGGSEGELIELDTLQIRGTDSSYIDHMAQVSRATRLDNGNKPSLSVALNPNPARPSEPLTVGLAVSNPHSSPLSNVELRLRYPEHLSGLSTDFITTGGASNSVTCFGDHVGTSCAPGEVVVWSLGTIPPGGGVSVDMYPDVQNVADGTLIQFEAEVWVDGVQTLQRSRTVPVQAVPQFELSVDELMDPVTTSGDIVYTFTYSSIATTISNTQLSFALPDQTSFVSATDGGIYSSGLVIWDLQSLQGGSGGERRVRLAVDGSEGELVELDTLQISGTDSSYIDHMAQVSRATRLDNGNKPSLSVALNPNPARPSEPLTVGLAVSNPHSSPLSNVELRLRYPEHLSGLSTVFITTGGDSNSVTCFGDHVGTSCAPGEVVVWSLGTIPPGGGVFVDMHPDVQNVADGTLIQVEAEVWVDGVQTLQRSRTVPVQSAPQFELSVDELMDPVSTEGDMVYTFTYSNIATTISNTQLSFALPDQTSFVSATDGGIYSSGMVTWDLQSLQSGSGGERRVRLAVDGSEGELVELDTLQISGTDSSYIDHLAQVSRATRLDNGNKPRLSVLLNPDPARPSESLTVGLAVSNPHSNPLSNVELRLRYPEHLSGLSTDFITTGGASNSVTCFGDHAAASCAPGEIVVWSLGTIPSGVNVEVEMAPDVLNVADGTQIPFEAELRVDGKQVISAAKTIFVGSNFDFTGYPPICADINNDADITLEDLIVGLQIMAGMNISLSEHGDCSGDGQIGMPEIFSILQELK